jgi:hypothetical protein
MAKLELQGGKHRTHEQSGLDQLSKARESVAQIKVLGLVAGCATQPFTQGLTDSQ